VRGTGRSRTIGRAAALLLLAVAVGGCGKSQATKAAALRLQREDLVAVSRALQRAEPPVATEVAATKAAWPLIANGLPADVKTLARPPIQAASAAATKLRLPPLFAQAQAAALTGPGSGLAGLYRAYSGLATHGWPMIGAAIDQIEHGAPVAARFARANVALYIESIYDAHFGLAQLGKGLVAGYQKLGGPAAFGSSLTQAEVDALARAYSEGSDRLHPHVGVKLGS
jgi:hypothetical protein